MTYCTKCPDKSSYPQIGASLILRRWLKCCDNQFISRAPKCADNTPTCRVSSRRQCQTEDYSWRSGEHVSQCTSGVAKRIYPSCNTMHEVPLRPESEKLQFINCKVYYVFDWCEALLCSKLCHFGSFFCHFGSFFWEVEAITVPFEFLEMLSDQHLSIPNL